MTPVTHLLIGPPRHGVVRFGADLVAALRHHGFPVAAATMDRPPTAHAADGGVHLQVTDRLFGRSPEAAAAAVLALAEAVHARGAHLTATLHDLPQPSDGTNHDRRRRAYCVIAAAVDGVVVCSAHEQALLVDAGARARATAVVPLPIDTVPATNSVVPETDSIGIFGYVYPGKGHEEVLAALAGRMPGVEVRALGEASAGHDDLIARLHDRATRSGVRFTVTGHLPDRDVAPALRRVTVPVAHHRHVSASGSLNSWLAAGRRPLAPSNRYTREIEARNPGALLLYPDTDAGLREALGRAFAEPAATWLPAGTRCAPTRAQAAAQYAALLGRWHR